MKTFVERLESRQLLSGSGAPTLPHLVFTQEPTDYVIGQDLLPTVDVAIEDAQGNILTSDQSDVTLSIASGPAGAILGGDTTLASFPPPNNTGIVEFGNLSLTSRGVYTLQASDGAYGVAISSSFTVTGRSVTIAMSTSNLFPNVNQPVTLTATVSPVLFGVPDPSGTMTFKDGTTVLGIAAVNADPTSITYSSTATINTSWAIAHTTGPITVSYSGDPVFEGVDGSSSFVETVAPTSPVAATLRRNVPKAPLITGQKIQLPQVIAVNNAGGTPFHAPLTGELYLTAGTTIDSNAIDIGALAKPITHNLRDHAALGFNVHTLSASIPAGPYHLLVHVTDPSGTVSTIAASAQTINVVAANRSLSGIFENVPATVKVGKTIAVTFDVINNGNVPLAGPLQLNFYYSESPDIDRHAARLKYLKVPIRLRPGQSKRLHVGGLALQLNIGIPQYLLAELNLAIRETSGLTAEAGSSGTITVTP